MANAGVNAVNSNVGKNNRPKGITNWRLDWNLGGPVYIPKLYDGRNKTFFFYDQHTTRNTVSAGTYIVDIPSQRMLNGDFSRYVDGKGNLITIKDPLTGLPFSNNIIPSNRISPVTAKVRDDVIIDNFSMPLKYILDPDSVGRNGQYPSKGDRKFWSSVIKIDQNIGTKHVLTGSYNWGDRSYYKCGIGWPGFNRFSDRPQERYQVGHTWVAKSKIVNQLRVAFYRHHETRWTPRSFTDRSRFLGYELVKKWGIDGITDNSTCQGTPPALPGGLTVFDIYGSGVESLQP